MTEINSMPSLLELLPGTEYQYDAKIMSFPTTGIVSVTNRCNLACPYCFNKQNGVDMDFETADMTARFLLANAAITKRKPTFNFFGGEPLLKFDDIIVPLVNKYNDAFSWGMTTNGTLLDEGIVDWLYKHHIQLLLSVDGCKQIQDKQRPMHNGKSSFDILAKILPYLLIYYPDITFRSTLTRDSLYFLDESIETIENFRFSNFTLIPNLFELWQHNDYLLWKNFIDKQAIKIMRYLSLQQPLKTRCNNLITGVREIELLNTNGQLKSPLTGCGMGIIGVGVSPDGHLHACQEENSLNSQDAIGDIITGIDVKKQEAYCHNLYNNWIDYIKKVDQLDTSPNFKLYYANSYCSTRLKDGFACNTTQTAFLKGIHQSATRLYLNYHLTLNPYAQQLFN